MFHFLKNIIFLFLVCLSLSTQGQLNSSLGNIRKTESDKQEYTFVTDQGKARVIVYSPNVLRIRIGKEKFAKNFSYAVVAHPEPCNVKMTEAAAEYVLQTDSLTLRVQKKPLRFSFYTKNGQVINADDPSFGTSWLGEEVTTYKTLQKNEIFIGLGEHAGDINRREDYFVNWNTDDPGYNNNSRSLYASIPFYIGLHSNLCYGVFLDNTSQTIFNMGAGNNRFASFSVNCGEMDYYFIYHSNVRKIIESYTWLTGRMPLPPVWSLGYQQCRYSYFPEATVLSTAQQFRERNIPADMIYLDIHYMDQYKIFTWDKERFPDPSQMIAQLKNLSFHTTLIIDPGVKVEDNYDVYNDGVKSGIFIRYPDGTYYQGKVWPGWCNFPDFTMPKARDWWGNWIKTYTDKGVTGFWNDMNEIAAWGKDVPRLLELNWEGNKTSYREGKNIYGFQMARSSYEGAKKNMDGRRPFVLTRAGFSGLQRYTAIWTGDNQSTDDHMFLGIRLLNSMGVSGLSFTGMDIGGFGGNPTQNLYTRWMEIGAFTPMYRGHTAIYTNHTEPWAFGEISEDIARRYIGFRYQLMPYLYSAFYESTQDGMPVLRSLAIDYSAEPRIFEGDFQQQYLFGPSILVAPVRSTQDLAKVYLPSGKWFDLFTDKPYQGGQTILTESPLNRLPLFVRAGSIIPMQKLVESTADDPGDTLFLHLYEGAANRYVYYEDDGETFNYTNGSFYKRAILYDPAKKTLTFEKKDGNLSSRFKKINLVLHGFNKSQLQQMTVNGNQQPLTEDTVRFFTSHFKFADYGPDDTRNVLRFTLSNSDDQININW